MLKAFAAGVALALSAAGFAQTTVTTTTTLSPAAQQVQLLAPQLVSFAGSTGNFDSLVNGLTTGAGVTLTTATLDGQLQVVTFVPGTTFTPLEVARQLESARQNLIVRGVATPSAQQLAVSVVGGTLPTVAGNTTIPGVITGAPGGTAIQVRNDIAALSTLPATALNLPAADLQALRTGAAAGTLTALQVNQALQLANLVLAQQGIVNPTPEQIRVALFGGTLTGLSGTNVAIHGVLQGSVTPTSASPAASTSTSASQSTGTSNTPPTTGPLPAPPAALLAPGVVPPPIIPSAAPAPAAPTIRAPSGSTAEGANRARSVTRPGG